MTDNIINAAALMFIPLTMLGMGAMVWKTKPPFGDLFGYRTTYSQKNERTWVRAQELFGRLCTSSYTALSAVSLIGGVLCAVLKIDEIAADIIFTSLYLVDFFAIFAVIFAVEGKLKREFDKDGNPKAGDANEQ